MKDRGNALPLWLQRAGYRTALVGKWLNGYGARDRKGEVPKGFDVWRGLLDVSAYDYHNFVMNRDGKLKTWGDPVFARKLVEFADIQVLPPGEPRAPGRPAQAAGGLRRPGRTRTGARADPDNYSPDVTGEITTDLVAAERRSKKPFFIWWSVAAPHREDVATTLMGRPGRDPRPPQRHEAKSGGYKLPRPPSFNEADVADKPTNVQNGAPELTEERIAQLQLQYEGRIGSLLAVDDHVKTLVATLKRTGQLKNTLIVFLSDNGWLQGEHRVPGDKYLPYEESVRVPFILRGPGVPAGRVVRGQVANVDFAPTLVDAANARAGRTMDGVSLLPGLRDKRRVPDRAIALEAQTRLLGPGEFGPFNAWSRPYVGVRTDRYTYAVYSETDELELYDRLKDPHQLRNVAADPSYADVLADMQAKLVKLRKCRGSRACDVAQ